MYLVKYFTSIVAELDLYYLLFLLLLLNVITVAVSSFRTQNFRKNRNINNHRSSFPRVVLIYIYFLSDHKK